MRPTAPLLATLLIAAPLFAQASRPADNVDAARALLERDPAAGTAAMRSAIARLRERVAAEPGDAAAWFRLGQAHFYFGDDANAAGSFDKAIALDDANAESHFMRGVVHRFQRQPGPAAAQLRRAAELKPGDARVWLELGGVLLELKQWGEAKAALDKAVAAAPNDAKAHGLLATALMQLDDKSEAAVAELRRAFEIDPLNLTVLFNLGQLHQNRDEPKLSLDAFSKLLDRSPADWRAAAKIVQCHAALGDTAARDAAIARVIELYNAGKVEGSLFCREQFRVGPHKVLALQHFTFSGERPIRYSFRVVDEGGREQFRVSLGSYDFTTNAAREAGEIGPNDRVWHLDGYYPGNEHRTFAFYDAEPAYDAIRPQVVAAIDGSAKAMSSTTLGSPSTRPTTR
jgi:cytochrome c-type biogenesis protein CcmH/NrfG